MKQRHNSPPIDPIQPPGDSAVPAPPPVDEVPPPDRFCDLVLMGGVASGVVYPWAIVELARHFRFRSIGGTSVGAMAAALAAAAEYGRRMGFDGSFEVLRRTPGALAETLPDGRTRMQSLFQPSPHGRRLLELWARMLNGNWGPQGRRPRPRRRPALRFLGLGACIYRVPVAIGAGLGAGLVKLMAWFSGEAWWGLSVLSGFSIAAGVVVGAVLGFGCALARDFCLGIARHEYGLCKGSQVEPQCGACGRSGLTDWLHVGIQRSAGLKRGDAPLTFQDLWSAPMQPGDRPRRCDADDPESERAINLQMFTTNVTHRRPYRLPLLDATSRLFFDPCELKGYFPPDVIKALVDASRPYEPEPTWDTPGKPGSQRADYEPPVTEATARGLFELPGAGMPIVVAARLSLSFPLLFSAVPLWAIDYEAPRGERTLRRCIFTDGGASSNFPIHLFDAALPRRPTFGFWLDRRTPYRYDADKDGEDDDVWLPLRAGQGCGDNWARFDPQSHAVPATGSAKSSIDRSGTPPPRWPMFGFLAALAAGATDWRDRTSMRLPHVRNRVARLLLHPDEGGLHIGMPGGQILDMAHRYGTKSGRLFAERFVSRGGAPTEAWLEQRWIRLNLLVNGLREHLRGVGAAAAWSAHSLSMHDAVAQAPFGVPVRSANERHRVDELGAEALAAQLQAIEDLESLLAGSPTTFDEPPQPELRLRAPL